jgi:hypothetical protein
MKNTARWIALFPFRTNGAGRTALQSEPRNFIKHDGQREFKDRSSLSGPCAVF